MKIWPTRKRKAGRVNAPVQGGTAQPQTPAPGAAPEPAGESAVTTLSVDGLRAWLAEVDRKVGVRTYAGAAAIVLALAAGIVGVVLATSAKDESATKEEVQALSTELENVGREAQEAAQDDVESLSNRLEQLESRVSSIASQQRTSSSELSVVQDDIEDLRSEISSLRRSGANGGN